MTLVIAHLHTDIPKPAFDVIPEGPKGPAGQQNVYLINCSEEGWTQTIQFQDGPVPEVGTNGLTIESLMGICAHRLEAFQNGAFPCEENAIALQHLYKGLEALHSRTLKRMSRGVEGKLEK